VEIISVIALIAGLISSLIVLFDILNGHRQQMWGMDIVCHITALYAGPFGL
jgi:hypothetical protein